MTKTFQIRLCLTYFRTEADNRDDYIRAELVEGRVKVTVKADGKTKVRVPLIFLCVAILVQLVHWLEKFTFYICVARAKKN